MPSATLILGALCYGTRGTANGDFLHVVGDHESRDVVVIGHQHSLVLLHGLIHKLDGKRHALLLLHEQMATHTYTFLLTQVLVLTHSHTHAPIPSDTLPYIHYYRDPLMRAP